MKSDVTLAKENNWKKQPDEAPGNSTYRIELTLAGMTKDRAFQIRKKIIKEILGFDESLWDKVSDTYVLTDLDVMNEKTGRYAQKLTDKY